MAIVRNHTNMAAFLVSKGADLNYQNRNGGTLLHLAAVRDQPGPVQLLLDLGLPANAADKEGKTPLDIAKSRGHNKVLAVLPGGKAFVKASLAADVNYAGATTSGPGTELDERDWNQTLLKNTPDAYLSFYKKYTNTSRMKVLTGTLKAEMGMQFTFGPKSDGPDVKKIILSLGEHPGFKHEVSVEDAARWKIIDYTPLTD
jgi:hypothetical protein